MNEFYTLVDIGKTYVNGKKSTEVLDSIDLHIKEHEFVCIMGSTGCGKSSLLQIMGGIERPNHGELVFKDKMLPGFLPDDLKKNFGYVFQNDCLLDWRTLEENVRMPLEVFRLDKVERFLARIDSCLQLVGLDAYKDCYPKELSGGMKQRGAIARALVHDPDILLLDHPFGALDAITRKMLGYELLKIRKQTQKTVIMITNNVEEALLLADRIIFLSEKPAKIVKDVKVPFTYEERNEEIILNETYLNMKEELSHFIKGKKA